jgi:hypothetical protein
MSKMDVSCLTGKMDMPCYTSWAMARFSIHVAVYITISSIHNIFRATSRGISFYPTRVTITQHATQCVSPIKMRRHCLNLVVRVQVRANSRLRLACLPGDRPAASRGHIASMHTRSYCFTSTTAIAEHRQRWEVQTV